jgi:hypothetical protein
MPRGPKGGRRPADVIGAAVTAARIATGEVVENTGSSESSAVDLGRKGGKARATKLSSDKRREIAKKAARQRWGK